SPPPRPPARVHAAAPTRRAPPGRGRPGHRATPGRPATAGDLPRPPTLRRRASQPSSADGAHGAVGLEEPGVVDAVPGEFAGDAFVHDLGEVVVAAAVA